MNETSEPAWIELFRYNNWANQQVLATCLELSAAQLETPLPGAYGTLRDTLEHILRSEAGYVRLLTGTRPQPAFRWEDRPDVPQMAEFAVQVGAALLDAASRVSPTDRITSEWDGRALEYHALAVFIQILNHGIEHRTNITTILNQGLAQPPGVDGWSYLLGNPARFELQ